MVTQRDKVAILIESASPRDPIAMRRSLNECGIPNRIDELINNTMPSKWGLSSQHQLIIQPHPDRGPHESREGYLVCCHEPGTTTGIAPLSILFKLYNAVAYIANHEVHSWISFER